jgi:hypothetical protein
VTILERIRQGIIITFCLGMFIFTVAWNLPGSAITTKINTYGKRIFYPLALKQVWGMFSGRISLEYAVRLEKKYQDGTVVVTDMRPRQVGFWRTSQNRLYEAMAFDTYGTYEIPMLKQLCSQENDPNIVSMTLTRAPISIPTLEAPRATVDPHTVP